MGDVAPIRIGWLDAMPQLSQSYDCPLRAAPFSWGWRLIRLGVPEVFRKTRAERWQPPILLVVVQRSRQAWCFGRDRFRAHMFGDLWMPVPITTFRKQRRLVEIEGDSIPSQRSDTEDVGGRMVLCAFHPGSVALKLFEWLGLVPSQNVSPDSPKSARPMRLPPNR